MGPVTRHWKVAVAAVAVLALAVGVLVVRGHASTSTALSLAGLDARIDPSVAPRPGAKAPIPPLAQDPPDLSDKIGLPTGSANDITFYFSLPVDEYTMRVAATDLTTPGTGSYRDFFATYADAARRYGAKPSDIEAAVRSVEGKGLSVMVDPSRTFVRVSATAAQWRNVLGRPLTVQKATPTAPFDVYDLPSVPKFDNLTYVGGGATVYDAAIDNGGGGYDASIQNAAQIKSGPGRRRLQLVRTPRPLAAKCRNARGPHLCCRHLAVQLGLYTRPSRHCLRRHRGARDGHQQGSAVLGHRPRRRLFELRHPGRRPLLRLRGADHRRRGWRRGQRRHPERQR
jgi:hypothetical protein